MKLSIELKNGSISCLSKVLAPITQCSMPPLHTPTTLGGGLPEFFFLSANLLWERSYCKCKSLVTAYDMNMYARWRTIMKNICWIQWKKIQALGAIFVPLLLGINVKQISNWNKYKRSGCGRNLYVHSAPLLPGSETMMKFVLVQLRPGGAGV